MNDIKDTLKNSFRVYAEKFIKDFEEQNKDHFFDAFNTYFKDRSDFETLLNKFDEDNKIKLIRLGFFYYIITKEIKHAGITLISIFSIMEAIDPKKFRTFDQWLLTKIKKEKFIFFPIDNRDTFKDVIISFQKEYYKQHGSSEKVRRFINKYFGAEDQQLLIRSFKIRDESIGFDTLNLNDQLKMIVDMLYNERSAFVHQGRLPQLTDHHEKMLGYFKIKSKYLYVSIELSMNSLQKMFERAFMKYLKETGI